MATVAELTERVNQVTRTDNTAASAERTLALACLNDAYQQAVVDTECLRGSTTANLTSGTASYDLTASPFNISGLMALRYITVSGDGISNRLLERVAEHEILSLSQGTSGAPVCKYAIPAINTILFWGTPGSSVTATLSYVKAPKLLHESTADATYETTPSAFPARFHYDLLVNLAAALVYEYEGKSDQAAFFRAQYERALSKFSAYVERFGGLQQPIAFPARSQWEQSARFPWRDDAW